MEENTQLKRKLRKERIGTVVSNKMDKSITVLVTRRFKHKKYQKYVYRDKKYLAHDQDQEANIGDKVKITETRPLSKRKTWRLSQIIERAK